MKNWILIVNVGTLLGVAGLASAQTQVSSVQSLLTPTQKAKFFHTMHLARDASNAMQSGDYALAEADARQSVATGPDSGLAQEVLAASLDAQGKTQEALQSYRKIAASGGSFPRNLLPYARLLLKAGDYRQAVWAYNKALPLIDDGKLLVRRGGFSSDMAHPTELAAAIQTALGLELDWRGYHGTYKEAIQQSQTHFQQALALEPGSPVASYYSGYGFKRLGRQAEAQAAFRKAAALGQGDVKEAARKELPETVQPK